MSLHYTTVNEQPENRKLYWNQAVTNTYFPLSLRFNTDSQFSGALDAWDLGQVSLSRLDSSAVLYQRKDEHLRQESNESYLITIPDIQTICFSQNNREVSCKPGSFILQRSHIPYKLSYSDVNRLWVLKIPASLLGTRISFPENLVTLAFDAEAGAGELMAQMVRMVSDRLTSLSFEARQTVGLHLVDLLALAVAGSSPGPSQLTSVQAAHLCRADKYIRDHVKQVIRPQDIADACGISLRYLHMLFRSRGGSVSSTIQEQRLVLADAVIQHDKTNRSIAEIAYEWGFTSPATFSQKYRQRFGCAPSEAKAKYREQVLRSNQS